MKKPSKTHLKQWLEKQPKNRKFDYFCRECLIGSYLKENKIKKPTFADVMVDRAGWLSDLNLELGNLENYEITPKDGLRALKEIS